MKVILASDHAGFALKSHIAQFLGAEGHEVIDVGAHDMDPTDDYPVFMKTAGERLEDELANGERAFAIVLGKSGQGEAMAMNRFPEVRAVVYYGGSEDVLKLSREHNDSNTLSLGAGFLTPEQALAAVTLWIATPFSGEERHTRRNEALVHMSDRMW